MSAARPKVLVTRPIETAEEFIETLQTEGYEPLHVPMLNVVSPPFEMPLVDDIQAIIVTSQLASFHFTEAMAAQDRLLEYQDIPVRGVGSKSVQAFKDAGFTNVQACGRDANDVADHVQDTFTADKGEILYLCGQDIAFDMKGALISAGFSVTDIVVYEARAASDLSNKLESIKPDFITFFSKRTAEIFVENITAANQENMVLNAEALCLSANVVGCVHPLNWKGVFTAEEPNLNGMMKLLKERSNNKN